MLDWLVSGGEVADGTWSTMGDYIDEVRRGNGVNAYFAARSTERQAR
jgi:hypothetical protein